jgi:hypothetical protein
MKTTRRKVITILSMIIDTEPCLACHRKCEGFSGRFDGLTGHHVDVKRKSTI